MGIQSNADTPWKKILETYFQDCLGFFLPALKNAIDWSKPPIFLDKELDQITKDSETGKRIVDKLVKVFLKEGSEACILFAHIEVQGEREKGFEERLYIYHNRIFDKHRSPVVTLAILTDASQAWRPSHHQSQWFGCEVSFKFPTVKLLDYQGQEARLSEDDNPFAFVVLAHLAVLEARKLRKSDAAQLQSKTELTRHLYQLAKQKDKGRDFVRNLVSFLDWILALTPSFELQYAHELHQIEEELKMTYVTSMERIAKNEGIREGEMQMLLEQMAVKFDSVPDSYHTRVTKGDPQSLRLWIRNILKAKTLDEVFKDPAQ